VQDVRELHRLDGERRYAVAHRRLRAETPSGEQHTAIVLAYLGNGTFDVADSNFTSVERVDRHDWKPPEGYTIWRLGAIPAPVSVVEPIRPDDLLATGLGGTGIAGGSDPAVAGGASLASSKPVRGDTGRVEVGSIARRIY
jgi:hypothetical protein